MSLRGLEMVLFLITALLLFGLVGGALTVGHVLLAAASVLMLLGITSAIVRSYFPYLRETREWNRFVDHVETLHLDRANGMAPPTLSGQIDRCHVTISPVDREQLIVVSMPTGPASAGHHEITLQARDVHNFKSPSLRLGDPRFDHRVRLRGSLPELVAVFDAETRKRATALLEREAIEVHRRHVLKYGRNFQRHPDRTRDSLEQMATLADRLFGCEPADVRDKLMHNAEQDPEPAVRALNLRMLFEYYPPDQRMLLLGRTSMSGEDPDLALAGAVGLAEAGDEVDRQRAFEYLAEVAARLRPDEDRAIAIDTLSSCFTEQAKPLLARLGQRSGPISSALLTGMVRVGLEPDQSQILERTLASSPEVQLEIARRLAEHGDRFEALAIGMLRGTGAAVQLEIVEGLIRTGTLAAVEALMPLTRGLLRSKKLRQKARLAVRAIQNRSGEGDGGLLSLAGDAQGDVSLPDGGDVSFTASSDA